MFIIYQVKQYSEINSMSTCRNYFFLVFNKFSFKYFTIHIFSSKHRIKLPYKMFFKDLLIIFQFITNVSPSSIRSQ